MSSPRRLPRATTTVRSTRSTLRFYHGDSLELLGRIPPAAVDVIVTSPPYNLGVQYRSYRDTLSEASYLQWTDAWIEGAARVLSTRGSLFLNVGNKPTQPWTAIDVALEARRHLTLQNTIHWIKSIVIGHELAGSRARLERDLAVGHYKPINSDRFLNDCHEFVFHFTPKGRTPLDRRAIGVPYQDPSNIGVGRVPRAACAAVATPGSSRTPPSRTANETARTPPRSPRCFPSTVSRFMVFGAPSS